MCSEPTGIFYYRVKIESPDILVNYNSGPMLKDLGFDLHFHQFHIFLQEAPTVALCLRLRKQVYTPVDILGASLSAERHRTHNVTIVQHAISYF